MGKKRFGAEQENCSFITGVLTTSVICNSVVSTWTAQEERSGAFKNVQKQ